MKFQLSENCFIWTSIEVPYLTLTPFKAPDAMSGAKSGLTVLKMESARFVKLGPRLARYNAFSLVNTGHLQN